jgi:ribosomal protein RSM22 (predicted rRNA methylase)
VIRLPDSIVSEILEYIDMPTLSWKTARAYRKQLNVLRAQMRILADKFAHEKPTEDTFSNAYFAYNFPMNYLKTRLIAQKIKALYPDILFRENLRICDVGCGNGAALIAIYHSLPDPHNAHYDGLDASRIMVKKCRYLMRKMTAHEPTPVIRIRQQQVADGLLKTRSRYDIILLANSLVEIAKPSIPAYRIIERLSRNLTDRGIIIIIEPALKTTARRLMELRNTIIDNEKLNILLPCLHHGRCPLYDLRGGKEWCHQSVRWKSPEYLQVINQDLNREISVLKFSYLVLSQLAYTVLQGYSVISSLLKEKGKKKCYLCTPVRRIELIRLDKHRSSCNQEFGDINKGDVIAVDRVEKKQPGFWYVRENTHVRILYKDALL